MNINKVDERATCLSTRKKLLHFTTDQHLDQDILSSLRESVFPTHKISLNNVISDLNDAPVHNKVPVKLWK